MRLFGLAVWRLAVLVFLLGAGLAFAQAATGTINGRVLDQGDAVLPGVTVTVTNQATGVVRTTVSNEEGVYSMPGLDPGVYNVTTDLTGFAAAARNDVTLIVNTTLTIDFRMQVASLQETLTVTGEAPLIEVTQSKVASTIETTELQAIPLSARNVSGMLALLPGAVQIEPVHRSKTHERDPERRWRRQSRQPVWRRAARLLDRVDRAVSAGDEPVQRGRRTHRGRGTDDGDEVGNERVPRVGLRVWAQ
jgi:hypothetical protein